MLPKYSFLISVYNGDNPIFFDLAVGSLLAQSYRPDEVVLVVDGPVSAEIDLVIEKYRGSGSLNVVRLPLNGGLGKALAAGLHECKNDIILRADSDDISELTRAKKQIAFMASENVDLCSTPVRLFSGSPQNSYGIRNVPISTSEIRKKIQTSCPFNHPSAGFRKNVVLKAGGYKDLPYCEDYYLWVRMVESGCVFKNIPEPLVNMRIDKLTFERRGNKKTIESRNWLNEYMYSHHMISFFVFMRNRFENFCRLHLPKCIKQKLYERAWNLNEKNRK